MAKKKIKYKNVLAINRRASFNYFIGQTFEAGIQLTGTEIKSVRNHQINIRDAYITIRGGETFLNNANISPYKQGNRFNTDPLRQRKLLLHKREISTLHNAILKKGKTIIPLRIYIKKGFVKILIAIGTGKKNYDKRRAIKERDIKRQINRSLKNFN